MSKKSVLARILALVLVVACLPFNGMTVKAAEADLKDVAYEVKYVLNEDVVLDENHELKQDYIDMFKLGDPTVIKVAYVDDTEKSFNNAGWTNRLRLKGGSDVYELTYKKRYTVENDDVEAALALAKADGFEPGMKGFEAEIDWGYEKKTLSFSCDVEVKNAEYSAVNLPKKKVGSVLVRAYMPVIENHAYGKNWGKKALRDAVKYAGPVTYKKYKGKYDGKKVSLEVWPITDQKTKETQYLVEFSFDADDYKEASTLRPVLMDLLEEKGILKKVDSLKTGTVYNAYYK